MQAAEISDTIERFIRVRFSVSSGDRRFGTSVALFDEGYVDSMGVAEVLAFIEDTFGVEIPDDELMSDEFTTIDGMARVIARLRVPAATRRREAAEA